MFLHYLFYFYILEEKWRVFVEVKLAIEPGPVAEHLGILPLDQDGLNGLPLPIHPIHPMD